MYTDLLKLEAENRPIRIAVIGAGGAMGKGICLQTKLTPGLRLAVATDLTMDQAISGAELARDPGRGELAVVSDNSLHAIQHEDYDVMVETTNSIESAAKYCIAALKRDKPVILMNAEVDLLFGPYLHCIAERNGTIITSNAGDQYSVIAEMIDEIETWGFKIVMAGNIKGFLNRYAVAGDMQKEADKRHLEIHSCVAQTDGTKINIEMALLCNAFNLSPTVPGMLGPRCAHVHDALNAFDFDAYKDRGVVDYILGAQPGGGVFVIGKCEDKLQQFYLNYYKLHGKPPYYLFYRPYHLCHLETPRAIAKAFLFKKKVMEPTFGKVAEVFAYAKKDLFKGMRIDRGIGGDDFYGMVDVVKGNQGVPIALFEGEGKEKPILKESKDKDELLTWGDVDFPSDHYLRKLYGEQSCMDKGNLTKNEYVL